MGNIKLRGSKKKPSRFGLQKQRVQHWRNVHEAGEREREKAELAKLDAQPLPESVGQP